MSQPAAEALADLTREELFKVLDGMQADLTAAHSQIEALKASQAEFDRSVCARVSELGIIPLCVGADPVALAGSRSPNLTEQARARTAGQDSYFEALRNRQ